MLVPSLQTVVGWANLGQLYLSDSVVKDDPPSVIISNGTLHGIHLPTYNQSAFLGIPYAEPPINDRRYVRAQSIENSWDKPKVVDRYSDFCPGYATHDQGAYTESEDCLTINVIRPNGFEDRKLPVLTWIHGGGYYKGGSGDLRYNLSFIVNQSVLSKQPVIAVSFNYRLGGWGFLAGDAMESLGQLNLGLHDQRLALHWIRENIGAFGGDANKITIWGQSAGGSSVGYHLVAYGGKNEGLFRAAIMQSGTPIPFLKLQDVPKSQQNFNNFLGKVNCKGKEPAEETLKCLQQLPFQTLQSVLNGTSESALIPAIGAVWNPIIDGDMITEPPSISLREGRYVHVPIIMGSCTDDGTRYAPTEWLFTGNQYGARSFMRALLHNHGFPTDKFVTKMLGLYPSNTCFGEPFLTNTGGYCGSLPSPRNLSQYRRLAAYVTDSFFVANHRATCEAWSSHGDDAYCFRFNAQSAGQPWYAGVMHLQDVAFTFYNIRGDGYDEAHAETQGINPFEYKPNSYYRLSDLMSRSWISFVNDLNPNSFRVRAPKFNSTPEWPKYTSDAQQFVFDAECGSHVERDDYRAEGIRAIIDNADQWGR